MLGLGQKGTFPLREKCPYLELFLSAFTCIRTEYGEILRISPYSVRMREKADQNNSECGHFSPALVEGPSFDNILLWGK